MHCDAVLWFITWYILVLLLSAVVLVSYEKARFERVKHLNRYSARRRRKALEWLRVLALGLNIALCSIRIVWASLLLAHTTSFGLRLFSRLALSLLLTAWFFIFLKWRDDGKGREPGGLVKTVHWNVDSWIRAAIQCNGPLVALVLIFSSMSAHEISVQIAEYGAHIVFILWIGATSSFGAFANFRAIRGLVAASRTVEQLSADAAASNRSKLVQLLVTIVVVTPCALGMGTALLLLGDVDEATTTLDRAEGTSPLLSTGQDQAAADVLFGLLHVCEAVASAMILFAVAKPDTAATFMRAFGCGCRRLPCIQCLPGWCKNSGASDDSEEIQLPQPQGSIASAERDPVVEEL
jgi:hypothetical protein